MDTHVKGPNQEHGAHDLSLGGVDHHVKIPINSGPAVIRNVREFIKSLREAYVPWHVFIGPMTPILYQQNIPNFQEMHREDEKKQCLDELLGAAGNVVQVQQQIVEKLKESPPNGFYDPAFVEDPTDQIFLEGLVQDGCYILSHCFNMQKIMAEQVDDGSNLEKFLRTNTNPAVVHDVLFLYVNQIPFEVLETLYSMSVQGRRAASGTPPPQLKDLMVEWVCAQLKRQKYITAGVKATSELKFDHLLELAHMIITQSVTLPAATTPSSSSSSADETRWYRATSYETHAAVSFLYRPLDGGRTRSVLDVNLSRYGRVHVPPLSIYPYTPPMLCNLMLLEKYNSDKVRNKHVTSYCFFLSKLARHVEDVTFLIKRRIIDNNMRNDDLAADIISKITSGFSPNQPDHNYLHKTAEALESRLNSCIYQNIAWFRFHRMRNQAMTLVTVAGIIIFICTIVQTVYAIRGTEKGK